MIYEYDWQITLMHLFYNLLNMINFLWVIVRYFVRLKVFFNKTYLSGKRLNRKHWTVFMYERQLIRGEGNKNFAILLLFSPCFGCCSSGFPLINIPLCLLLLCLPTAVVLFWHLATPTHTRTHTTHASYANVDRDWQMRVWHCDARCRRWPTWLPFSIP